jgi:hypothetical protein
LHRAGRVIGSVPAGGRSSFDQYFAGRHLRYLVGATNTLGELLDLVARHGSVGLLGLDGPGRLRVGERRRRLPGA